jgi:hypothetical protein
MINDLLRLHSLTIGSRFVYSFFIKNIIQSFKISQVKVAGMAYVNLTIDEEDSLISFPNNISHMLIKKKKINLLQLIREKAEHLILRKR